MDDSIKRLETVYRGFSRLSPKRKEEFLKALESFKQFAISRDVLDLFNEIEAIFKENKGD